MRIGIISPYSLSVPGGVQMQALGLARALRSKGYSVRVLGPCDGVPPDVGVTPLGNSLPTIYNGSTAPIALDPACQLRTIRAIRDEAFDVIHLHEPLAPGPTITTLLARPTPLLGTFHAAGTSLGYDLMPWVSRFLASRLDHRTAVSEESRNMAYKALGGSYDLLYNGVDLSSYRSTKSKTVNSDSPTILFIGRHEPRKGLAVLLEAFSLLPGNTRLWVAGRGPETSNLRTLNKSEHSRNDHQSRVEWLGTITDDEKIARLKKADVFCAPSLRGESFGIVLLEAMAAGTAVVATDLPGYRSVATSGINSLLVPPQNPRALARAINSVLTDEDLSSQLTTAGHEQAKKFSMGSLAEHYLRLYKQISGPFTPSPGPRTQKQR